MVRIDLKITLPEENGNFSDLRVVWEPYPGANFYYLDAYDLNGVRVYHPDSWFSTTNEWNCNQPGGEVGVCGLFISGTCYYIRVGAAGLSTNLVRACRQ